MTENRCNTVLVAYSALPKILKDYDSAFRARLQSSFMSAHLQRGVTTEKLVQEMLDINGRKLAMLQLKEIVERAAGSIPTELSNTLVLRFVKGKTFQEIADIENISVRTAFRRFDRARDSFAAALDRLGLSARPISPTPPSPPSAPASTTESTSPQKACGSEYSPRVDARAQMYIF